MAQAYPSRDDRHDRAARTPFRKRLSNSLRANPTAPLGSQVAIGVLAAAFAVAVRYVLPLGPDQLPTVTVVIMLAVVTTFIGVTAGIVTGVLGGLLSWYLFFTPFSWSFASGAWIPLLGFAIISAVIITTSYLYRRSERLRHSAELARLQAQAKNAELFAREMAHRLKNALTIAQSMAFQTIGTENDEAKKFAGRLRALTEANELLSEHVAKPTAKAVDVVMAALRPFRDGGVKRWTIDSVDALVPAQQVVSLALAVHELATNASEFGALSTSSGTVTIKIEDGEDRLNFIWKEHGSPAVQEPGEAGFGTRFVGRAGIRTQLAYEPDGVRCSIELRKA